MGNKKGGEFNHLYEKNKILAESEERYKNFIALSSEGIWRFEFDDQQGLNIGLTVEEQTKYFVDKGFLAECNDAMARMYGYENHKTIIGTRLSDFFVLSKEENTEMIKAFVGAKYSIKDAESLEKDNKGNIKYFLNNLVGIVKDGKIYGAWGTQRDITDRKKSEDAVLLMNFELTKKNEQLLKINTELDNFIFSVSHDLNTPLSNIEGLINVLKLNDYYTQEEPKMMIDLMVVAVARFKNTIKELTEVTKAQIHQIHDNDEIFLVDVLEEVKLSIKNLIGDTSAQISADFTACEKIRFKKMGIQSVIYNLLSNALKYRHPDRIPEIGIKSLFEGEYVILEVKDNGIGIPSDQISQLFTMFKRLHSHIEGTGIGLYILKRIVETAGGKVELESELNKGSVFRVFIKAS